MLVSTVVFSTGPQIRTHRNFRREKKQTSLRFSDTTHTPKLDYVQAVRVGALAWVWGLIKLPLGGSSVGWGSILA